MYSINFIDTIVTIFPLRFSFFAGMIFALVVDPSLGKVDKSSFSEQMLLEIFFAGIKDTFAVTGKDGVSSDISEWRGVHMNENRAVTQIIWSGKSLRGSIDLQWVPPKLKVLRMGSNSLSGTLDLTVMPDSIERFEVNHNSLTGSINLRHLPSAMKRMYLSYNEFSGCIDLTHLPACIRLLSVAENSLSGSLDLTRLPEGMEELYLYRNGFFGVTDFSNLPNSLMFFNFSDTQLTGELQSRKNTTFVGSGTNVRLIE